MAPPGVAGNLLPWSISLQAIIPSITSLEEERFEVMFTDLRFKYRLVELTNILVAMCLSNIWLRFDHYIG